MNTLDALKAGRELLSEPKRWGRGSFAQDATGIHVPAQSKRAVCWCALGALHKVAPGQENVWARIEAAALLQLAARGSVSFLNDNSSHEDVLRMYDGAIASKESRAA
jgi:hypothetical protein